MRPHADDFVRLVDGVVLWEWNADTDRIVATPNLQHVYGLIELPGVSSGFSLLHPADSDRHQLLVEQAVERNRGYSSRFRIIRPDNHETVWISEHAEAVRGVGIERTLLFGFAMNVTAAYNVNGVGTTVLPDAIAALDEFVETFLAAYASDVRQHATRSTRVPVSWVDSASAFLSATRQLHVRDLAHVPAALRQAAADRKHR